MEFEKRYILGLMVVLSGCNMHFTRSNINIAIVGLFFLGKFFNKYFRDGK